MKPGLSKVVKRDFASKGRLNAQGSAFDWIRSEEGGSTLFNKTNNTVCGQMEDILPYDMPTPLEKLVTLTHCLISDEQHDTLPQQSTNKLNRN